MLFVSWRMHHQSPARPPPHIPPLVRSLPTSSTMIHSSQAAAIVLGRPNMLWHGPAESKRRFFSACSSAQPDQVLILTFLNLGILTAPARCSAASRKGSTARPCECDFTNCHTWLGSAAISVARRWAVGGLKYNMMVTVTLRPPRHNFPGRHRGPPEHGWVPKSRIRIMCLPQ